MNTRILTFALTCLMAAAVSCGPNRSNDNGAATVTATGQPTPTPSPSPAARYVQSGDWGGRGIALDVTRANSLFELDCAHGKIDGALKLNSSNRFHATGTIVIEHGGPQIPGEQLPSYHATFDGIAAGILMNMTISYSVGGQAQSNTYNLVYHQAPDLTKCL